MLRYAIYAIEWRRQRHRDRDAEGVDGRVQKVGLLIFILTHMKKTNARDDEHFHRFHVSVHCDADEN